MAAEKKTDGIKIRFEPSLGARLDKLCSACGRGRADVIRQAVEGVLREFENTGAIEFPITVTSGPLAAEISRISHLPDDWKERAVSEHFRSVHAAKREEERYLQFQRLAASKPKKLLKQLEDYWQSPSFVEPHPEEAAVGGFEHKGRHQPVYWIPSQGVVNAGGPNPPRYYDLFIPVLSVERDWGWVMKVHGRGMEPSIPDGSHIAINRWFYTDFPDEGTVVIYNSPEGFGIGELRFREAMEGEKATSRGVPFARHTNPECPRSYLLQPGDIKFTFFDMLGYPEMLDLDSFE